MILAPLFMSGAKNAGAKVLLFSHISKFFGTFLYYYKVSAICAPLVWQQKNSAAITCSGAFHQIT